MGPTHQRRCASWDRLSLPPRRPALYLESVAEELIDIGDVAERSGLPPSTLRLYERKGLLVSVSRNGLRRQYDPTILERLALIVLCQRAGFRLAEIAQLVAAADGASWRTAVETKLSELGQRRDELDQAIEGLTHVTQCPAETPLDCSHFIEVRNGVLPVKRLT